MIAQFRGRLNRAFHDDSFLGLLINPHYLARSQIYSEMRGLAPAFVGRIVDFGCGSKPYQQLFNRASEYLGVDLMNSGHNHADSRVDIPYDGNVIPLGDAAADAVVCFQVLEHVFEPEVVLGELSRVMRKGGKMLVTVPLCWEEHEIPYDYARYSSYGLIHLLEKNGFKIIEVRKLGSDLRAAVQVFQNYLHVHILKGPRSLRILMGLPLMLPLTVLVCCLERVLPRSGCLYLDSLVLAEKANVSEST